MNGTCSGTHIYNQVVSGFPLLRCCVRQPDSKFVGSKVVSEKRFAENSSENAKNPYLKAVFAFLVLRICKSVVCSKLLHAGLKADDSDRIRWVEAATRPQKEAKQGPTGSFTWRFTPDLKVRVNKQTSPAISGNEYARP